MKVKFSCYTDGSGFWSEAIKKVDIEELGVDATRWPDQSIEDEFGELRVTFSTDTWSMSDGLIYTDKKWIHTFKHNLHLLGFSEKAIEGVYYSEQGMQGDDFVSLDVDHQFIKEYRKISGEEVVAYML